MATSILDMPNRWAAAWSGTDSTVWIDLYSPSATYTDHAFRIRRTGHELLRRHHQIWRTSNPDFTMTIDPNHRVWWRDVDEGKGSGQCLFRTINIGTFEKDLPSRKASGRAFEFCGMVELTIQEGLIINVEEWYTIEFDLSVPVPKYG